MAAIQSIQGREILDSRANTTLEVDLVLTDGSRGRASVPSGASTGRHEAYKLEDITRAIANVDLIAKNLIGQDAGDQQKIDLLLINSDGTENKSNLGGNVTLAISLASAVASAASQGKPLYHYLHALSGVQEPIGLPMPMFNIINGGKHADSGLAFQEFMVVPTGGNSFRERAMMGVLVFQALKTELMQMGQSVALGDEGGFAPRLNSNEEAIEVILSAIGRTRFKPKEDIDIALDVAASSIPDLKPITYPLDPLGYYEKLVVDYPIRLIEDPLTEDDWSGWTSLTARIGSKVMVVGDDLFTTNKQRLQRGIQERAANAVIIKPDQIGTLTETLQTVQLARSAQMAIVVSHRSGETESTFIADLAVGIGAEFIKSGGPSRGERIAKYNQLLRIEEELSQGTGAREQVPGK
ncbi:phosphopyruvate hydratase [Candidatus Berkelbacteria bacterium]|nr:phosphopyruvate hydratase [Candidatus Berkelbacteria bacterium]